MNDVRLNIWVSDVRSMLDTDSEVSLAKAMLSDSVIDIEEAIDCYVRKDIEAWLERWAEDYGYVKVEE